jgi:uncharacterized membrane protein YjfL (UPF0719 family)
MNELQLITFLVVQLRIRLDEIRADPERGDVAEKVIIVGIFVALAIVVGAIITHAVEVNATHLSTQIQGAQ